MAVWEDKMALEEGGKEAPVVEIRIPAVPRAGQALSAFPVPAVVRRTEVPAEREAHHRQVQTATPQAEVGRAHIPIRRVEEVVVRERMQKRHTLPEHSLWEAV